MLPIGKPYIFKEIKLLDLKATVKTDILVCHKLYFVAFWMLN